jgi:hypothetical protein
MADQWPLSRTVPWLHGKWCCRAECRRRWPHEGTRVFPCLRLVAKNDATGAMQASRLVAPWHFPVASSCRCTLRYKFRGMQNFAKPKKPVLCKAKMRNFVLSPARRTIFMSVLLWFSWHKDYELGFSSSINAGQSKIWFIVQSTQIE